MSCEYIPPYPFSHVISMYIANEPTLTTCHHEVYVDTMITTPNCDPYPKATHVDSCLKWTWFGHENLGLIMYTSKSTLQIFIVYSYNVDSKMHYNILQYLARTPNKNGVGILIITMDNIIIR